MSERCLIGLCSVLLFFFLMIRQPPGSTLFPYTDALPISLRNRAAPVFLLAPVEGARHYVQVPRAADRKSTRLNSSHVKISYAVFCLKKKKHTNTHTP